MYKKMRNMSSFGCVTFAGGVGATTPAPGGGSTPAPHDVMACCQDSAAVTPDCLLLCDYSIDHAESVPLSQLLSCSTSLGHVFKCAAGTVAAVRSDLLTLL